MTCPALDLDNGGLGQALRAVDCRTGEGTAVAFGRLFGAHGTLMPALTGLLTLYVAIFAIGLLTGRTRLGISSLTPRMMTIGLVLTFATSWLAYQNVIWTLATGAPDQIATIIAGTHGPASAAFADKLDAIFSAIADSAKETPTAAVSAVGASANGATPGGGMFTPQGMLWLSGLMLLVGTVGVLVTAKVALAALLALGPLFILMALFGGTRGLFEGWLKAVVAFAMIPMFTVLIGGAAVGDRQQFRRAVERPERRHHRCPGQRPDPADRARATGPADPRVHRARPRFLVGGRGRMSGAVAPIAGGVYLDAYLAPLQPWLAREDVTEILVNRPGELWVESAGAGMQRIALPEMDDRHLQRLAEQVARISHQGINRERPLLAAMLPDGARVQFVAPSATRAHWALAIRRHRLVDLPLSAYDDGPLPAALTADTMPDPVSDPIGFLTRAVRGKLTILISGGTSTGKTTFLNALLGEVLPDERIILVEDTPEIRLRHANALGLVAVKGELGEARIGTDDLLQAALRLRPDRIVLGELRGREAVSFLRAINTGHPGSFSTIHANSPTGALEQLALMVMQAGLGLDRKDTLAYARSMIDIVVQLGRVDGRRRITAIDWISAGAAQGHVQCELRAASR